MTKNKSEQWYTNKELYEKFMCMFNKLEKNMDGLEKELAKTRSDVKQYNGLVGKLNDAQTACIEIREQLSEQVLRCNQVQAMKEGRSAFLIWFIKVWPVALSTILFILAMLKVVN